MFYFDWKFGWEASKPYTAPAVVAYFLLNGAFSYWLWFVEKGVVYEGEGKTGKVRSRPPSLLDTAPESPDISIQTDNGFQIRISSSTKKHIPIYECDVVFTPTPYNSNPEQKIHIRAPMTRWFTSDGYFTAKPFQQWLASEVPVIGAADPDNVVEDIGRGSGAQELNLNSSNAIDVLNQLKASGASFVSGEGRRRK